MSPNSSQNEQTAYANSPRQCDAKHTRLRPVQTQIRIALLGSGELGKEVAIECARLGAHVVACDRYDHAPAMQVTPERRVFNMCDPQELRSALSEIKPDLIVPEIEALATEVLLEHEDRFPGSVVPNATAVHMTMNRERIRKLAAEELGLSTSKYAFCSSLGELQQAGEELGYPLFVKPVMSSSGKGQSKVVKPEDLAAAWETSQSAGRVRNSRIIAEAAVSFDSEFTLLTVRSKTGITFCEPIGHIQQHGDFIESWQPHPMPLQSLASAKEMAAAVVNRLGGYGLFGVEFFLAQDQVIFSELSPRPHDTGCVTLASQQLSEFALHVRAFLGLPVTPEHTAMRTPAACRALKAKSHHNGTRITGVEAALAVPGTDIRIFGKPEIYEGRRMAIVTATGLNIDAARGRAEEALKNLGLG
jgi:phosphoribosylglycinamide formyltransferase 2